jgi:CHAT domain-containing protein
VGNLDIKSQLVVLSACYAGAGQFSEGEGVLSIGRSFLNAGCSSICMSMWRSSYKPTIYELEWFYRYLLMGKRKDKAMQLAKLKFLRKSGAYDAHPRHWAHNIVVGNNAPLFSPFSFPLVLAILGTGLGTIVLLIRISIRRVKRKRKL